MTDSARLLVSIFLSDILPIFVVAGIGFLLARYADTGARPLSRVTFYALSPCLVFHMLVTSRLGGVDFGRMALFCVLVTLAAGAIARVAAIGLRLDRPTLSAFLLAVMFSNGGNYGLPVAMFAFGREALTFATVYFATGSLLTYTAGIFLAGSGRRDLRQALVGITRVPAVYGAGAAAIVLGCGIELPLAVTRPVALLNDAALPMMMLVLGMQLEHATKPDRPGAVVTAVGLSLFATPAAAFLIARLLDLQGPALQAGLLQAAMPTAVVTTILALQYEIAPNFVTSIVILSTLLSPLTLTPLIALLQRIG